VLDLSHSLLEVAKQRIAAHGWTNVETVEADATTFRPAGGPVDVVTFSYSLTMIPDWFAALENALAILKPGGTIGVVDFYVSRKYASDGSARHGWFTRTFWPTWFALDNVYPSPDHVPFLHRHFDVLHFEEHRAGRVHSPQHNQRRQGQRRISAAAGRIEIQRALAARRDGQQFFIDVVFVLRKVAADGDLQGRLMIVVGAGHWEFQFQNSDFR